MDNVNTPSTVRKFTLKNGSVVELTMTDSFQELVRERLHVHKREQLTDVHFIEFFEGVLRNTVTNLDRESGVL